MSEEIPSDTPKRKSPAKKAVAKKAAVKKASAKKEIMPPAETAPETEMPTPVKAATKRAKKQPTAAPEPEPEASVQAPEPPKAAKPRMTAIQKKAAEMLAQLQRAEAEAAAAQAAVEAARKAALEVASQAQAPATKKKPKSRKEAFAPDTPKTRVEEQADESPEEQVKVVAAEEQKAPTELEPAAEAGSAAQPERKKSRWERWKERRERFKAEKLARRQALLSTAGAAAASGATAHSENSTKTSEDEVPATPEVVLGPPEPAEGVLELNVKGHGFLRLRDRMFAAHPMDTFIHADIIRQLGLREGMLLKGIAQKGPRGMQMTQVQEVNGRVPESVRDWPLFEELKAINPNKRVSFETTKERVTTRVIDMFTPVGRGQRGLIVAPPRTGKTTLLQHIAESIVENHPGMHLIILLVDERPEEVTEFKRVFANAEVYASSNDQDVKSHTRIATFAIERAKRLVECGEHVFMLMDSITRLARAFNNSKSGGATMSGGMGVGAMEIPRRLFAAARNTRGAGSLTILATALIETGSRMDELIFLEFKGTGNMELVLDRKLAEQYYYPAVNIFKSGTRREELLLPPFQLDKIHMLRRGLAGGKPIDAIQRVLTLCERYPSNAQMLVDLPGKAV